MKKNGHGNHFLGNGTKAEGTLICDGQIRIDGHFKGYMTVQGPLMIGTDALINATIHTTSISIAGEIHGSITAEQFIEISPSGKVFGKIQTPNLIVHEGAVFEGQCQMSKAGEAPEGKLVPIMSDKSDEENRPNTHPVKPHEEQAAGGKA